MEKGLALLLAVIMVFSLSGCSDIFGGAFFLFLVATGDDRADKDEVLEFVCKHEEALLQAIEDGDFSSFENQGLIKEIDADDTVADFYCGGAGVGSGTSYVSFYYIPDNDMTAVWCAPSFASLLTPSGNGYEWQESSGDNRYYTEHICGNFYYYEASFCGEPPKPQTPPLCLVMKQGSANLRVMRPTSAEYARIGFWHLTLYPKKRMKIIAVLSNRTNTT